MSQHAIEITRGDAECLHELLACLAVRSGTDTDALERLRQKLDRARIVSPSQAGRRVVTLWSRVTVEDDETWESRTYTLVYPGHADFDADGLSILTPMGIAILGHREGDAVEWEVPMGAHRIRILKVLHPPEAAGHELLKYSLPRTDEPVRGRRGARSGPMPIGSLSMAMHPDPPPTVPGEDHSSWRLTFARRIAVEIDPERFGVRAAYVFGSTVNGTAGPGSDINLLIHLARENAGRRELEVWFEGWSLCLAEINYHCTGYRSAGLLDVHFLTDDDINLRTSYAIKIGAVADPAEPLTLGPRLSGREPDRVIRERHRPGLFDG